MRSTGFVERNGGRQARMLEYGPPATSPPTWARIAAHLAALTPAPSALWRLMLVLGFSAGYTEPGLAGLDLDGARRPYLILLGVLSEAAALLTLGLVSEWGERVPRWVPGLGGRVVILRAAVVAAALGATGLILLWTPMVAWWPIRTQPDRSWRVHDRDGLPAPRGVGTPPHRRHCLLPPPPPRSGSGRSG